MPIRTSQRPATKHVALYFRQLASILAAGIPIAQGLDILSRQAHTDSLQSASKMLAEKLHEGQSLASSMQNLTETFPPICSSLVSIGEKGGVLDEIFTILNAHLHTVIQTRKHLRQALLYPSVVLAVLLATTIFLLVVVVPTFEDLFVQGGVQLPLLTQLIVGASRCLLNFWFDILCIIIGAVSTLLYFLWSSPTAKNSLERALAHTPILRRYIHAAQARYYGGILSHLIRAGIPHYEVLTIIEKSTTSFITKQRVATMKEMLQEGTSFAESCRRSELFPPLVNELIDTGEQTGTLDLMLTNAIEHAQSELDQTLDTLKQLLEPSIMIILGLLVGTLVIGLYLPLFQIGDLAGI
jgi:type IV pilus assembly protein PilC